MGACVTTFKSDANFCAQGNTMCTACAIMQNEFLSTFHRSSKAVHLPVNSQLQYDNVNPRILSAAILGISVSEAFPAVCPH